jgi:RimJ/RimL family protein N-acetyltransferase
MPHPLRTYKIITPRTVIRCYQAGDGALVKQAVDDSLPELLPFMTWAKFEPETPEAKEQRILGFREKFLKGEDYTLGIFNHDETELLGSSGFHARVSGNALEIGYWINSRHTGIGLCTEVVNALTKVGFEIEGLDKIVIHCEQGNDASKRVAEKCGYTYIKSIVTKEQPPRVLLRFEMKKREYKSINSEININVYAQNGENLM